MLNRNIFYHLTPTLLLFLFLCLCLSVSVSLFVCLSLCQYLCVSLSLFPSPSFSATQSKTNSQLEKTIVTPSMKTRRVLDSIHTKELYNLYIFIICSETCYYIFSGKTMFMKQCFSFFHFSFLCTGSSQLCWGMGGMDNLTYCKQIFSSSQVVEKITENISISLPSWKKVPMFQLLTF